MNDRTPRSRIWPDAWTLAQSRIAGTFRSWTATPDVDRDKAYDVLLALLVRYACGECLFLADAVAKVCARPHHVVAFTMPGPDGDTRLAHAVLCFGSDTPWAETKGYDILGVSPLGGIAHGLSRLGPIRWSVMSDADRPRPDEIRKAARKPPCALQDACRGSPGTSRRSIGSPTRARSPASRKSSERIHARREPAVPA